METRRADPEELRGWLAVAEAVLSLAAGVLLVDSLLGGELRGKILRALERPEPELEREPVYGVAAEAERYTRAAVSEEA